MGEREVRVHSECCRPLWRWIIAPHGSAELTGAAMVWVVLVFLVIFVPFLIVAVAGGGRVDYISECDSSMWSFIVNNVVDDCNGPFLNASHKAKGVMAQGVGFGAGIRQCRNTATHGRSHIVAAPMCKFKDDNQLLYWYRSVDQVDYAALRFTGASPGKLRMCARMQLSLDYPGAKVFDGFVLERFNGDSGCSAIAFSNLTRVVEKTVEKNCGDLSRAELSAYLWTFHNNKNHYFTATCATPAAGGVLTLTSDFEKHEWCNDLFSILSYANFSHPSASGTILHTLMEELIPNCANRTSLTLWNSYNTSCRVL